MFWSAIGITNVYSVTRTMKRRESSTPRSTTVNGDDTFGGYAVHPVADIFPMMGDEELSNLADDIQANGLRNAIQIGLLSDESQVYVVIDGRNRYRACELAGVKPRFARNQMDPDKIGPWIISHNLHRRHLTTSQKAAVAVAYEPALAELAAQRQRAGVKIDLPVNLPEGSTGTATDEAAAIVGVSGKTVRDAKYVSKNDPDMFEQVKKGEVTASGAARELRARHEEQTSGGGTRMPPLPGTARRKLMHRLRSVSSVLQFDPDVVAKIVDGDDDYDYIKSTVMLLSDWVERVESTRKQ
ncbi:MAG: hypothetical protein INR66_13725 [Gordonia polyisoprenivorans]|nr:hypothetical protein [Gordonia polyisoprenivorans]